MPTPELPPNDLLLVLPPLTIWRPLRRLARIQIRSAPDRSAAVGCVIFTASAVAVATHYLIGPPWNVGFLLGAIVVPPDVVAPLAIARKLAIPPNHGGARRRGVGDDAVALILYRFAVVAISTACSAAEGDRRVLCHRRRRNGIRNCRRLALVTRAALGADPQVEITLSLITPYVAYRLPEVSEVRCHRHRRLRALHRAGTNRC